MPSSRESSFKLPLFIALALVALVTLGWVVFHDRGDRGDPGDPAATAEAEGSAGQAGELGPRTDPREALAPATARAAGAVRSSSGEALAGAFVTLAPLDGELGAPLGTTRSTTSDADGSWRLEGLSAGRYVLSATAPDHLPGLRGDVVVRPGADLAGLDLVLEPGGGRLSGTVSDVTGGVVEGARVSVTPLAGVVKLRERESVFAISDEQGRYALSLPAGRVRVRVSHPDYSREQAVVELAGEGPRTRDFALVPMASIEGIVLREAGGSAVPHAEVHWGRERSMMLPGGKRIAVQERGGTVEADGQGRFRISGLPPGTVSLRASASQLASASPLQIPVGIAEPVTGVELFVAAASDLRGRVVAEDTGEAIAGAELTLTSPLGRGSSVTSDEEGRFVARGLLPGRYDLLATAQGYARDEPPPSVEIEAGAETPEVVVELGRARTIRGRVEPAAAAEVAIELRPESVQLGSGGGMFSLAGAGPTRTEAETGAFELGPVRPGRTTLEARTADGRGGTVEVDVGQDGAEDVVITLEARAVLAGIVVDAAGEAVDDVSVRARKRRTSSLSITVNGRELTALSSPSSSEGQFELAGLAAGEWEIEVIDAQGDPLAWAEGRRAPLQLELAKGEHRELRLRVESRDGRITGVVLDDEGHPVADAWVSAAYVPAAEAPDEAPSDEGEGSRTEMRMLVASDDGPSLNRALPPVLTDAEGRFELEGLRRGEYVVTAEAGGGATKASAEGVRPDARITLRLAPLGAIEGRVLSNGQPADCMARVRGPIERAVRVRDGRFELERLEPGRYRVEASSGDGATSTQVEVEPGQTVEVELALERFATITGTVVDESGEPIVGAEILIGSGSGGRVEISRDGSEPHILTGEDGSFETRAAAGQRVLIAQTPGMPMPIAMRPFVVEAGKDLDLGEIRKRPPEGMMTHGDPGRNEEEDVVVE